MRIRSSDSHFALINSDMISNSYNFGTLNASVWKEEMLLWIISRSQFRQKKSPGQIKFLNNARSEQFILKGVKS